MLSALELFRRVGKKVHGYRRLRPPVEIVDAIDGPPRITTHDEQVEIAGRPDVTAGCGAEQNHALGVGVHDAIEDRLQLPREAFPPGFSIGKLRTHTRTLTEDRLVHGLDATRRRAAGTGTLAAALGAWG